MKPCLAILALILAACSKTPPPETTSRPAIKPAIAAAPAPAPAPAEPGSVPPQPPALPKEQQDALMRAIFGEGYDAGAGKAFGPVEAVEGNRRLRMTFEAANTLPDGRTAVIVNVFDADDKEDEYPSLAAPGILSVYLLRRQDAGWEVLERHESVAAMGSMGRIGTVTWLPLDDGKPCFMIASNSFNRGFSVDGADLFIVDDDEVQPLGGFVLATTNDGACLPGTDDCWAVGGTVRVADGKPAGAYRDLLVDFTGKHYTVTEDKNGKQIEHITTNVRQTARYRFNGKEYVLFSGTNPVPGI